MPRRPQAGTSAAAYAAGTMISDEMVESDADELDPDPFTIGLAIFGATAGGGAFLEARRQRRGLERVQRDAFRSDWYSARRSLIHFKRNVDEFETYVMEEGFGRELFRIGTVRLTVTDQRQHALRRLRGQAFTTAQLIGDTLDDLSNHLGIQDQERVDRILAALAEIEIPERYSQVVRAARRAIELYQDLLDDIDEREGFTAEEDVGEPDPRR